MTTVEAPSSHLKENPWEMARSQLRQTASQIGMEDSMLNVLLECKKAVAVSVPTRMDDGSVRVFEGSAARTTSPVGPQGGIRVTTTRSRSRDEGARRG